MSISPKRIEVDRDYIFKLYDPHFDCEKQIVVSSKEMDFITKRDSYFNLIKNSSSRNGSDTINFNQDGLRITKNSFQFILSVLLEEISPVLTSDHDVDEIRSLVDFFSIGEYVGEMVPPSFETLLKKNDRIIREAEIEIRKILYSEESIDHRCDDIKFLFDTVLDTMNYRVQPRSNVAPSLLTGKYSIEDYLKILKDQIAIFEYRYGSIDTTDNEDGISTPNSRKKDALKHRYRFMLNNFENYYGTETRYEDCPFWGIFNYPKYYNCDLNLSNSPYYLNANFMPADDEIDYPHLGVGTKGKLLNLAVSRSQHLNSYLKQYLSCEFLDGEDWGPLVMAGGSVTALLTGMGTQTQNRADIVTEILYTQDQFPYGKEERDYTRNTKDKLIKDIDLFLITKDPSQADIACQRLMRWCQTKSKREVIAVATSQSFNITLDLDEIVINFQIILRLYNSISQVITGFDIDSCSAAWDGKQIYTTQRFGRALYTGYNIADPERQSTTYAYRLIKYLLRGFAIALPGLSVPITKMDTNETSGVMRIVEAWKSWCDDGNRFRKIEEPKIETIRGKCSCTDYSTISRSTEVINMKYMVDVDIGKDLNTIRINNDDEDNEIAIEPDSDKIKFFRSYLSGISKDFISNYNYYTSPEELFEDTTPIWHPTTKNPRKLLYITKNPGSQLTNSFQPLDEEWFATLYIKSMRRTETLESTISLNLRP